MSAPRSETLFFSQPRIDESSPIRSMPNSHRVLVSADERLLLQERRWAGGNVRGLMFGVILSAAGFWLPVAIVTALIFWRR